VSRRVVDKLARVHLKEGGETWVLVHVEVQGRREEEFPKRLYQYHYRLLDKDDRPVATFAVLADPGARWRPRRFHQEVLGCAVSLRFPAVKLLDFRRRWQELEESDNPAAVVTMAHLMTQETARDPARRLAGKLWMVRRLQQIGLSLAARQELFRLVDWLMALPVDLQLEFDEEIARDEEEGKMPYVTSFERRAMEKGRLEGRLEGRQEGQALLLVAVLEHKFGALPEDYRLRVAEADQETLQEWARRVLAAERLEEVFG
ncbi:MAG: cytosolic protein, partial [Armatimonadetes bacterium]|nr:cytosolic protein [Armatimonadota bacterium]